MTSPEVEVDWLLVVEQIPQMSSLVEVIVDRVPNKHERPVPITELEDKHLIWLYGALVGQVALMLGQTIDPECVNEHVHAASQLLVDRERERRACQD